MAVSDKINKEVRSWISLGLIIVVSALILLNILAQNPANIACNTGFNYSAANGNCINATNSSFSTSLNGVGNTLNTFVTGISEPQNWVAIVIIAIIGISLFKFFSKRRSSSM